MMDENDWLRLTRYFADEATEDERRETERWIAAVPARAELVGRLRLGWEWAVGPGEPVDVERAWDEVVRRKTVRSLPEPVTRAGAAQAGRPLFVAIDSRRVWRRRLTAAAAAAALALGAGTIWRGAHSSSGTDSPAAAGRSRVVATRPGQIAEVYLSDGTHVRLGAASTLRFPTTFGADRQVYLDGEGYFDVVHDPKRAFVVRTARAVVRDIGTQFNVHAYPNASSTEVVVTEGVVALKPARAMAARRGAPDSVVLRRADLGRVDAAGELAVTHEVNADDYLAWMQGRLVFAAVPLRDVLPQLNRWYGVDFMLGDMALGDVRLTATFDVESLPDALRRLSALLDARTERRGQTIVIYPIRRQRR